MKKFLRTFLFFSLLFFLFDKVFYLLISYSPGLEADRRLEYVLEGEINKDIIVFGSSRGARNILADQLQDSTGISAYNLSYPGSDIEFHEFLLRTLLKYNRAPKIVLLVVDEPTELLPSESLTFRLDRLYPLVKYNHVNQEMINRGEKTIFSKILMLHRINKKNFDVRQKHFTARDTVNDSGSMPLSYQKAGVKFTYSDKAKPYSMEEEQDAKVAAFLKFRMLCEENDIQLVIVFPPNFHNPNRQFISRIINLAGTQSLNMVYDTTRIGTYNNKAYYFDEAHLMKNGAEIFTGEVSAFLKNNVIAKKR